VHAPLTAILLLFEMTNDYRIILPLMFSVAISLVISRRLQSDSVYTLGLARKGIRLERQTDLERVPVVATARWLSPKTSSRVRTRASPVRRRHASRRPSPSLQGGRD
jgi:hypothetical protein